jgi:Up-Regulated in long-lived daf-2
MSYNSSANIMLTNNTGANANLHLSHRYSTDSTQQATWPGVPPGGTVGPLVVGYNTGFIRYGMDWWWCGAEVLDGTDAGNYASEGNADDPGKECFLQSADDGKTLTFAVSTTVFMMSEMSGPCTTPMSKASDDSPK